MGQLWSDQATPVSGQLHNAIHHNDMNEVFRLLDTGVSVSVSLFLATGTSDSSVRFASSSLNLETLTMLQFLIGLVATFGHVQIIKKSSMVFFQLDGSNVLCVWR